MYLKSIGLYTVYTLTMWCILYTKL